MDIDFEFWLVMAVAVTLVFWVVHKVWIKKEGSVEWVGSLFPVLLVVFFLRSFLVEPFTIPSGSMLPTLQIGDYILVNKFAYGLRLPVLGETLIPVGEPERGDVMVFRYPVNRKINFIKRVVGLPGDTVIFKSNTLFINGQPVTREFLSDGTFRGRPMKIYAEDLTGVEHLIQKEPNNYLFGRFWRYDVPEGHYFVMGDNRENSRDSRAWGFVPEENIVGKAFAIWMHKKPGWHLPTFSRDGGIDGELSRLESKLQASK